MSEQPPTTEGYAEWSILELMGHRRLAGFVQEVEMFGSKMLRIDIPHGGPTEATTQYYGGSSIYCVTPTTEDVARGFAQRSRPAPVNRYELEPPESYED